MFINIIATELAAVTSEGGGPALDRLMCLHQRFPRQLRRVFYEFYYKFLPDYKFKKNFVKAIINNYGVIISEPVTADNDHTDVLGLCVQLFTVSSICLEFVQSERLLHVLLKHLHLILSNAMGPEGVLLCEKPEVEHNLYWKAYVNVRYVIANTNVTQYACYHLTEILSEVRFQVEESHGRRFCIRWL